MVPELSGSIYRVSEAIRLLLQGVLFIPHLQVTPVIRLFLQGVLFIPRLQGVLFIWFRLKRALFAVSSSHDN